MFFWWGVEGGVVGVGVFSAGSGRMGRMGVFWKERRIEIGVFLVVCRERGCWERCFFGWVVGRGVGIGVFLVGRGIEIGVFLVGCGEEGLEGFG